ncbi:MAG: UDP-N-acetylglucosamine 2-epimerase, partial [Flavobacteriales bacterium]|nr:UDP-N-acetylglucosamine 2-epimerase [Flavobacteriales bacterium]
EIPYERYAMLMFHPVTTEPHRIQHDAHTLIDVLLEDTNNYIVIYPNNDLGSSFIINEYERFSSQKRFRVFPSLRFEYFLVMLKYCQFIIGNSSAGIREAPYYGVPSINIGTRQNNRALNPEIINCIYEKEAIEKSIERALNIDRYAPKILFGRGESDKLFLETITKPLFWEVDKQKVFMEIGSIAPMCH